MLAGYDRDMLRISVSAVTSASPEQVLGAASDFSEQRAKVWPNVKAKHLEVHDSGAEFAEVTEGIWIIGLFWERCRYEWSQPGSVKATVLDSNVLEPGSTWELRAVPRNGGSAVEMILNRNFRTSPKGTLGSAVNHLSGKRGWGSYLRRVLAAVEKQSTQSQVLDR
jgi:hypothetical protein